jgi:ADP-ribose pyrophosphatase
MKTEYANPWFKVVKDGRYHFLKESGSDNGAVVLLLLRDKFVFVKVNRPAHQLELIEAPRGYGDSGETSELCAVREVREETGYVFDVLDLEYLGSVRPNSAILSSVLPVYLIESSEEPPMVPVDDEVSEVIYIPKKDIHAAIAEGRVTDGITLSALALYWARVCGE